MLEDLCRAILTKDNKKYEFVTFDAELPGEAQYQKLENNHKFDFCVKQSFKSSPYMGAVSVKNPEYGFYLSREDRIYDRYFSKKMKLEELLSDDIRECYEPKKTKKTTSGNEFSSGKFYSVASSSRLAVSAFTKHTNNKLDYIDSIKIENQKCKITKIKFECDSKVKGIDDRSHCPQLDVYFTTEQNKTVFVEVKNHEILDSHKTIKLRWSYFENTCFLREFGLDTQNIHQKTVITKKENGTEKEERYVSINDKFLTAKAFNCNWKGRHSHFDFKQFLCHLMGILSYAEDHKNEEIYFYYVIYRNELYEQETKSKLYEELEAEVKEVFKVFGKKFPKIHFGLCYNYKYDTLEELQSKFLI